jgi:phosphatidylglycerol:prolipoprotein diacylglycerol transferase
LRYIPLRWYDRGMMPELVRIGPLVIQTYTALLDLAILGGLGVLAWQGRRVEQQPVAWLDAGLSAVVGGIIFGRGEHILTHWDYFSNHAAEIVQLWRGGLDWHGAVVGGLAGLVIFCAVRHLSFRRITDTLALILPVGAAFTYTGCLMARCGYGREVETLASYPPLVVAELPDLYGIVAPRLTSQLYGIAWALVLTGIAALLARLLRRSGVRFWLVLMLLSLGSFGIGFTRGDVTLSVGMLRLDQAFDLVVTGIGLLGALLSSTTDWPVRPAPLPKTTDTS